MSQIPVITIDGPSGSGKGTVTGLIAQQLGWNVLDSGAIYRVLALAAEQSGIAPTSEAALRTMALQLQVEFVDGKTLLGGADVGRAIRTESVGTYASQIASLEGVREGLLQRQRDFARSLAWLPMDATWEPWCSPMRL